MRRLSLRARLLLGVCLLAAVGLVAADIATYASLRSFLVQQVDAALESGHQGFGRGGGLGSPPPEGVDWVGFGAQSGGAVQRPVPRSGTALRRSCRRR